MNVIWIIADTVRTDAVGAYGNKKMHTPALDALAAKGIRFDRHYIASFPTMSARADFMTGRWTMSYMQWEPLPKYDVTLAEIIVSNDIIQLRHSIGSEEPRPQVGIGIGPRTQTVLAHRACGGLAPHPHAQHTCTAYVHSTRNSLVFSRQAPI